MVTVVRFFPVVSSALPFVVIAMERRLHHRQFSSRGITVAPLGLVVIDPRRSTMDSLVNVRVAILVTDGFEQSELSEPRAALDKAGAVTSVVSPKGALLLPGGVMNPDALRMHPKA